MGFAVREGVFPQMRCELPKFRSLLWVGTTVGIVVFTAQTVFAQGSASTFKGNDGMAQALVREVIHNEVESQLRDKSLWCYREQQEEEAKPSKTLQVCQTKDGEVERLIALNGRELSLTQKQAEDDRIQKLVDHPDQLRAKQKKEREDGDQERALLATFPDAFLFQCEHESGNLVSLRFRPNPAFRPATRSGQVFHHMEGTLVVNAAQKRLVEIDGRLVSEVKFLGGLLGHLDKDGTFCVKQQEVGDGHWDLMHMSVHMNGKALFFKTITVLETKNLLDYKPLPRGATLQQTADFLTRDFDVHTASSSGK
jgi:hypothetical protein